MLKVLNIVTVVKVLKVFEIFKIVRVGRFLVKVVAVEKGLTVLEFVNCLKVSKIRTV